MDFSTCALKECSVTPPGRPLRGGGGEMAFLEAAGISLEEHDWLSQDGAGPGCRASGLPPPSPKLLNEMPPAIS